MLNVLSAPLFLAQQEPEIRYSLANVQLPVMRDRHHLPQATGSKSQGMILPRKLEISKDIMDVKLLIVLPTHVFHEQLGSMATVNFNIALNKTSSRSQESFKLSFVPSCSNFLKMIFPKSCRFVVLTPCQQYLPVSSTWCNILSSFTRCKTASGPPRRCKMGTKSWKNQVWSLGFQHIKLYLLLWDHRCLLQL